MKDEINNAYKDFKHLNENAYNLEETQSKISMNYEYKDILEDKLRKVDLGYHYKVLVETSPTIAHLGL